LRRQMIALLPFIVMYVNAGFLQRIQIPKDRPTTHAAQFGQLTGVVASARLK